MEVTKTKIFEITTRDLIKNLVRPNPLPYHYNAWLLERWKDEEEKRVILCRNLADQRLCWSYGIPAVGTPIGIPWEGLWFKFLLSFPELLILEPRWEHETFGKAVTTALKFGTYAGEVKRVRFPIEVDEDEHVGEAVKKVEAQFGIEFNDILADAISKASVIDLKSLPSELEQSVFDQALNFESKFSSVGIIMEDEDQYSFKILTTYVADE